MLRAVINSDPFIGFYLNLNDFSQLSAGQVKSKSSGSTNAEISKMLDVKLFLSIAFGAYKGKYDVGIESVLRSMQVSLYLHWLFMILFFSYVLRENIILWMGKVVGVVLA
ncbi:hypothetical protein FHS30_002174 [Simiduia aestuariiviva]|uniref:Uncharacterized protein n=1 Tax=Simiduia aestuariiviva TaxID=1510459 RepID=A0A839USQ6_9GAMM|nr:hypothetical protein [Simiduia aestuariiviva]